MRRFLALLPMLFLSLMVWGCSSPENSLKEAREKLDVKDYATALKAVREARHLLLKEDKPNPKMLGTARYLEFMSLYDNKKPKEALALLGRKEPKPYVIPPKDAGWMGSAGAELAAEAGDAELTKKYSNDCITHRRAEKDAKAEIFCSTNACSLLGKAKKVEMKTEFGLKALDVAVTSNAAPLVVTDAVACVLDGVEAGKAPKKLPPEFTKHDVAVKKALAADTRGKGLLARMEALAEPAVAAAKGKGKAKGKAAAKKAPPGKGKKVATKKK